MSDKNHRRQFLKTTATAGGIAGLSNLGFLSRLAPVSADEAKLDPKKVRYSDEMEPLVRLLEETPRERVLEEVADRIKKGLPYKQLLAALLLAGVRDIQPRPVGFKFHAVLVVNSAHLASLASPDAAAVAADLLGDRRLQEFAGAERQGRQLGDGPGR